MESCYDADTFPNDFCGKLPAELTGNYPGKRFSAGYVNAGLAQVSTTVEFDWNGDLSSWPVLKTLITQDSLELTALFFPDKDITLVLGSNRWS